jgi:DNA repair protein RadC
MDASLHHHVAAPAPVGDPARGALIDFLLACGDRDGVSDRADKLLERFGTLGGLLAQPIEVLSRTPEIGQSTARLIASAKSMVASALDHQLRSGPVLADGSVLVEYLRLRLASEKREILLALHLDSGLHLLADEVLGVGTLDSVHVPCREIVRRALELGSAAIIMVHNHPSGDATPSHKDVAVTRRLTSIAKELDLRLLDHIIIAGRCWTSMRARRLM